MSRGALIVGGAVLLVAASGGIVSLHDSQAPVLCGITPVTDRLLQCPKGSAQPSGSSQNTQSAQSAQAAQAAQSAQSATAAGVARTGPVIRSSTTPAYVPDTVVVRFRRGVTARRANALLAQLGARPIRQIDALHTSAVTVPHGTVAHALARLNASGLVVAATRDEVLHVLGPAPNDANYSLQWGLPLAGFPIAWNRTRGSRAVTVAVLDTGVNGAHPDLAGSVKPGIDLTGSGLTDTNGHGTAVAGVVAAHANNAIGGAGVCPACTILPIKVMNADGGGDLATVAQGIVRAVNMHARVIDLSLGGPVGLDALKQAVAYAVGKGVVVVAAAGNSGRGTPFYPANYPNVLSVAGSTSGDRLYGWSERGTWIRVAAPGCNVAPLAHGGYGMFCGTSSATPLVAGLAALAVSLKPRASNLQVIRAVERAAHRIGPIAGFGRIDAGRTLAILR